MTGKTKAPVAAKSSPDAGASAAGAASAPATIPAVADAPAPGATVLTQAGGPTVRITALQNSRWRRGRCFTREATVIPRGDLMDDEMAAFQDDPLLLVVTGD